MVAADTITTWMMLIMMEMRLMVTMTKMMTIRIAVTKVDLASVVAEAPSQN